MAGPEARIEQYLVREARKLGGIAEKFSSPNKKGVPDRLCSFPFGLIFFVELKAEGQKPTPLQKEDHSRRRAMGFEVRVLDSKVAVDKFIKDVVVALKSMRAIGNLL